MPVNTGDVELKSFCSELDMAGNPFSTRYVIPGVVPFFFERAFIKQIQREHPIRFESYFCRSLAKRENASSVVGLEYLADTFLERSSRAQLVGPHGSGKSTLMQELRRILTERGTRILSLELHDGTRCLDCETLQRMDTFLASGGGCIFLDGFEQLAYIQRLHFRTWCRAAGVGYLISTHRAALGIPVLFRTVPSFRITRRVVDYLLDDSCFSVSEDGLVALFRRHQGNIRNVLFDLYDRYEDEHLG
ncbi:MAG: hypothetical protein Q4G68_13550 [Planctomycetia bacterium]|nr:hypothetical protein [Planctomycetia bacterium]